MKVVVKMYVSQSFIKIAMISILFAMAHGRWTEKKNAEDETNPPNVQRSANDAYESEDIKVLNEYIKKLLWRYIVDSHDGMSIYKPRFNHVFLANTQSDNIRKVKKNTQQSAHDNQFWLTGKRDAENMDAASMISGLPMSLRNGRRELSRQNRRRRSLPYSLVWRKMKGKRLANAFDGGAEAVDEKDDGNYEYIKLKRLVHNLIVYLRRSTNIEI